MHTAKLISITPDAEDLVAYCARVSNPANQHSKETAPRLLRYLIKHKHWSPFEMVNMVLEIKTTRAISAQILRHRSFSFQEFSQRYAEVQSIPQPPLLRRQDVKNRQNSIDDIPLAEQYAWNDQIQEHYASAYALYDSLLESGVAKECAREVLPLGSETTLYMNGTLRSWMHYADLRGGPETQLEHRTIAESVKDVIEEECPAIYEANGQYNTVDAAPANGAAVTVLSASATMYQPNLFYMKQAFGIGTVKLPKLYSTDTIATTSDGMSIRVSKYADGDANTQKIRFDLLPAYATFNPFMAGHGFGV